MKRKIGKKLVALLTLALALQGVPDIHPGGIAPVVEEVYAEDSGEQDIELLLYGDFREMKVGKSCHFLARVQDSNGTPITSRPEINWTSSDPAVLTVSPETYNSSYCQVTAMGAGSATITASLQDGSKSVTSEPITVSTVDLEFVNPDDYPEELDIGDTCDLEVRILNGGSGTVVWESLEPDFLKIEVDNTDTTKAKVTALAAGIVQVRAWLANDPEGVIEHDFLIQSDGLELEPLVPVDPSEEIKIKLGDSSDLKVKILNGNGNVSSLHWYSDEPDIVKVENPSGVVNDEGSSTIVAVSPGWTWVSVEVEGRPDTRINYEVIVSFDLNLIVEKNDLTVGETLQLGYEVPGCDLDLARYSIEWETSDEDILTVDEDGNVIAVGEGQATITANMWIDGAEEKATCTFTVSPGEKKLEFDFEKSDLGEKDDPEVGKEYLLWVDIVDTSDGVVDWKSSDESILTVVPIYDTRAAGTAKARVTAIKPGTATITASQGSISITHTFTVAEDNLELKFKKPANGMETMKEGGTSTLELEVSTGNAATSLQWSIADSDIVEITDCSIGAPDGIASCTIRAKQLGQTTIVASVNDRPDVTSVSFTINVTFELKLLPEKTNLTVGEKLQLALDTPYPSETVSWSSSDDSILTVVNGFVTALKPGKATVTASQTVDGMTAEATCTFDITETTPSPMPSASPTGWPETNPVTFYVTYNSRPIVDGAVLEMDSKGWGTLGIGNDAGIWPVGATINWTSYDKNIIAIKDPQEGDSKYSVTVEAIGPGYTDLEAIVNYGGFEYRISCQIHVPLELETPSDQINHSTSANNAHYGMLDGLVWGQTSNAKTIQLSTAENLGMTHYLPIYKYVKYAGGVNSASPAGNLITTMPELDWKSDDETVAKVDKYGLITAVSAGFTKVTVTTRTKLAGTTPESKTFFVIVSAAVDCDHITGIQGGTIMGSENAAFSGWQDNIVITANSTEIDFFVNTFQNHASDLNWSVYRGEERIEANRIKDPTKDPYINVDISTTGNGVSLRKLKAGVYYLVAWPGENNQGSESNPFRNKLIIKVIVPLIISENEIIMNKGDYYDLLQNVNIVNTGDFRWEVRDGSGGPNTLSVIGTMVSLSQAKLTALTAGKATIVLTYQGSTSLLPDSDRNEFRIPLTIIDSLALDRTSATIYVGSTLTLIPTESHPSFPLHWSSDNESILTVEDVDGNGKVTAKAEGDAVVTLTQTINGVSKTATCRIHVEASITSITLDPKSLTMDVGKTEIISATMTPKLNTTPKLYWITSDPSIVSIEDPIKQPSTMSAAKVKAVSGGTAVVTAINEQNIIVGSCLITVKQSIEKITLSETNKTVPLSLGSFMLYATISPAAAENEPISWRSTDTSVITVDQNGKVTLKKPGKASIICSSENGKMETCNVTVTKSVSGIKLDQTTLSMYVGETYRLTYVVTPSDASDAAVTWTSTNSSVVTVDAKGLLRARGVGQSSIILRTKDGGYISTCTVTVERTATAVKLDVKSLTLNTGDYYYLQTTITPADSTDVTLSWQSSDSQVAIVSNKGKVTAKRPGVSIVMVQTRNGSTAYCTVTVQQGVTGVELDSKEEIIEIDEEIELTADVKPRNATKTDVKWSSSLPGVARVDKEGNVKGVSEGVAIITCTTVDGGYVDYCVIVVEKPEIEVANLTVSPSSLQLGVGKSERLTATITPDDATNKGVIWSSGDTDIVTVDEKGRIRGISVGIATITCEAADGSGAEAYCEVEVCYSISEITLNTEYLDMVVGDSAALKANIRPSNATYGVHWESEDPTIALVNRTTGKVTAVKAGDTIITAYADDSSELTAICYVHVKDPVATTNIQVSESEIVMIPGETKAVSFTILPAGHTDGYIWSSDNPVVADVNSRTGMISAKSMGTANITIFADSGKSANVKVYVVGLSKSTLALQQYSSTIISLEVYGSSKSDLDIRWYSDNERVAEVAGGRITARAVGTTTVYAVVNGRTLPCRVTVEKIRGGS